MAPIFPDSIEDMKDLDLSMDSLDNFDGGFANLTDVIVNKSMDALKDHDIMKFVIIVMLIEHVIVLVKYYLEEYI